MPTVLTAVQGAPVFDQRPVAPVQPGLLTGFLERLSSVVADYESFDPAI